MPINTAAREAATAQVAQFIQDRLERCSAVNERGFIDPAGVTRGRELYATYRAWYGQLDREHIPSRWTELTLTAFGRVMGLFADKFHAAHGVEYRGVRVRADVQ